MYRPMGAAGNGPTVYAFAVLCCYHVIRSISTCCQRMKSVNVAEWFAVRSYTVIWQVLWCEERANCLRCQPIIFDCRAGLTGGEEGRRERTLAEHGSRFGGRTFFAVPCKLLNLGGRRGTQCLREFQYLPHGFRVYRPIVDFVDFNI